MKNIDIEKLILFSHIYSGTKTKYDFFVNNYNDLLNKNKMKDYFRSETINNFKDFYSVNLKNTKNILKQIENNKIKVINFFDPEYPFLLKNIPDAPVILFTQGNTELLKEQNLLAMVGARKTDEYGKECALNMAEELSETFTIVSGLAYGIDAYSHEGALKGDKKTIAVTAAHNSFPARNRALYKNILEKGLLISEFPQNMPVQPEMFLMRNRIIAGLSKGVFVVRATIKSGSLKTADNGLNYDRDIFALPGNIYEKLSQGTNSLISNGAICVTKAYDILNYYGFYKENKKVKTNIELTEDEKNILKYIDVKGTYIEKIIINSGLSTSLLIKSLMIMELKGLVKKIHGNKYINLISRNKTN